MMRLIAITILAFTLLAQTSNFPGAIDTDANLFVAGDNLQTKLTAPMLAGDTAAIVLSGTGFAPNMIVTVCDSQDATTGKCLSWEHMKTTGVSGNTLLVTRAQAGTTAVAHASGKLLGAYIDSVHQSALKSAVLNIQSALGVNLANVSVASTVFSSANYDHGGSTTRGIQEAVNAASAAGGGIAFVPPGTYLLSGNIQVPSKVTLSGAGTGATFLKIANGTWARSPAWAHPGAPGGYCVICLITGADSVVIRDLTVDENGANQAYAYTTGDISANNATNSTYTDVAVIHRMHGGTGVGMAFYGHSPKTLNRNNVIQNATVLALPNCANNTDGGGAYYIEGLNNRIVNTYAQDFCDTPYVVDACDHCSIIGASGDLATGTQSSPMYTLAGNYNTVSDSHCVASGSTYPLTCFEANNGTGAGTTGISFFNNTAAHCYYGFEINNPTWPSNVVYQTTFSGNFVDNCQVGVNLGHGGGQGVTISNNTIINSIYAGINISTASPQILQRNILITGNRIEHPNFGILVSQSGLTDLVKNLTITNNLITDIAGSPVMAYGIDFTTAGLATNTTITGNTITGATVSAFAFFNTWAGTTTLWPNIPGQSVYGAQSATCDATTPGMQWFFTDMNSTTWGAAVGGSGSTKGLAICNGTAWTLMSK